MRIVDIRETAIPLKSSLANSSFDFSEMTTSVVAVITDVLREGKPVAGFAFNSTGRYACGAQMRDRFIPRIRAAKPETLLDGDGNLDPAKILACMMQREKAGGHSERSIAIGTIEVAVWDAVAKIAGKPLHRLLAERFNGGKVAGKVFCYVGGGWYWPGQTIGDLQDEMRRHLDAGYTMVKMKVGGMALADDAKRVEAVKSILPSHAELAVDANCKFGRDEALAYAKMLAPFKLRWFEEPCDPLDFALLAEIASVYDGPLSTGENLFSTPDVENLVRFGGLKAARRDVIQVDPPQAYGIVQYTRTLDDARAPSMAARSVVSARRQPDVARDRRRLRPRRRGILSRRVRRFRRLRRRRAHRERFHHAVGSPRHRLRRPGRALSHHAPTGRRARKRTRIVGAINKNDNRGGRDEMPVVHDRRSAPLHVGECHVWKR